MGYYESSVQHQSYSCEELGMVGNDSGRYGNVCGRILSRFDMLQESGIVRHYEKEQEQDLHVRPKPRYIGSQRKRNDHDSKCMDEICISR